MKMGNVFWGILNFIRNYTGNEKLFLADLANSYGYSDDIILILRGNQELLESRFPDTYATLVACQNERDTRTPMEFGIALASTWVLEDFLAHEIQDDEVTLALAGIDHERKILNERNVTTQSDYSIVYSNQKPSRPIDLVCDYGTYWSRTHTLDLRGKKHLHAKQENALLFAIAAKQNQFAIINCKTVRPIKVSTQNGYGKNATKLDISDINFIPFTKENVLAELKKLN